MSQLKSSFLTILSSNNQPTYPLMLSHTLVHTSRDPGSKIWTIPSTIHSKNRNPKSLKNEMLPLFSFILKWYGSKIALFLICIKIDYMHGTFIQPITIFIHLLNSVQVQQVDNNSQHLGLFNGRRKVQEARNRNSSRII